LNPDATKRPSSASGGRITPTPSSAIRSMKTAKKYAACLQDLGSGARGACRHGDEVHSQRGEGKRPSP
jgi:hypothetical protein